MKKIISNENFYNLNVNFPLFISFILFALSTLSGIFFNYNFFLFVFLLLITIIFLFKSPKPLLYLEIILCLLGLSFGIINTSYTPKNIEYEITGIVDKEISEDYSYIKNIKILEEDEWKPFKGKIFLAARNSNLKLGENIWSAGKLYKTERFPFYSFSSSITGKVSSISNLINLGKMIKQDVIDKLNNLGIETDLLKSVIFGDKENLSQREREEISKSGIGHLFAVSGFHIGLFYLLISFFLSLFLVPYRYKISISLFLTFIYWLTTGPSISASRAFLMLLIYTFFRLIDYPQSSINVIGLSGIIFLLFSPTIIADVSFQLSFVATSALLIFAERITESKIKASVKIILIGCIPQIALLPLQISIFKSISFLTIPLTILFVPFFLYPTYIGVFLILLLSMLKLNWIASILGSFINLLAKLFYIFIQKAAGLNLVLNINENISYICALLVAFLILSSLSWHSGHKP